MDFSAPHVDFVIICYVVSTVMLMGMMAMIVLGSKRADRQLAKLDDERAKFKAAKATAKQ